MTFLGSSLLLDLDRADRWWNTGQCHHQISDGDSPTIKQVKKEKIEKKFTTLSIPNRSPM